MHDYSAEVKNIFGENVLKTISSKFKKAWFLVGFNEKEVFVSDTNTSIAVCRKSAKINSTYTHKKKGSIRRK